MNSLWRPWISPILPFRNAHRLLTVIKRKEKWPVKEPYSFVAYSPCALNSVFNSIVLFRCTVWIHISPSVIARRPRTWSGVMLVPRARSSSSVTAGHFSVSLRLDISFFNIPPPAFRSRWFASEPASESACPVLAAGAGVFREPFIPTLRWRERVVVFSALMETWQTAGGISRWR